MAAHPRNCPAKCEPDFQPPPCRVCGSVKTRELGNYNTACYTLIYCVDCGHKVAADGETPRESMEKCRRLWETPPQEPLFREDERQATGLLEEE